jgi:HAMP domain-containing protein
VARGDLSQKITVTARGEVAELADTLNSMTDTLRTFADEVTRSPARSAPRAASAARPRCRRLRHLEGPHRLGQRHGGQPHQPGPQHRPGHDRGGQGDLSQKITVDVKGELLELKSTINTMVDQLSAFASEVTRMAREVGTEGRLGGQAEVPGVSGTWKDLTDSVNSMASNLTSQVRNIAQVTTAVARGDLSQKITVDVKGELLELKSTVNTMVDQLSAFASEVTRGRARGGQRGPLGGQAQVPGVRGRGATSPTRQLHGGHAHRAGPQHRAGDDRRRAGRPQPEDHRRRPRRDPRAQSTVNTMVDQLKAFAAEVTRVRREVGSEGKPGGQAQVPGVGGTWRDLTDSVNFMAGNLTTQVRSIAAVSTPSPRRPQSEDHGRGEGRGGSARRRRSTRWSTSSRRSRRR